MTGSQRGDKGVKMLLRRTKKIAENVARGDKTSHGRDKRCNILWQVHRVAKYSEAVIAQTLAVCF